jgi:ParB-like chromosome segregation protein Spo0J
MHTKTVSTEELVGLEFRPIIDYRVRHLKDSISTRGYDPAYPLIVQSNHQGYLVVNGCHRLRALQELNVNKNRLSSLNIKTKRLLNVSGSGTAFFLFPKKNLFSLDELFSKDAIIC